LRESEQSATRARESLTNNPLLFFLDISVNPDANWFSWFETWLLLQSRYLFLPLADSKPPLLLGKGPSTHERIRVRFPVRFHARFAGRPDRDPNLHLTSITMVCLHISAKTNRKLTCGTPLAANRIPNCTPIRTQNGTCRRPLSRDHWQIRPLRHLAVTLLLSDVCRGDAYRDVGGTSFLYF
jgi:hypothetical protein